MIINKLLTPNKFSRPQQPLKKVKGIVIHWVANTNSTAEANRNFFENRKSGTNGYGSAHYIIGLQGETVQCLPDNELAYHVGSKTYTERALKELSNYPNNCTIGIECCHVKDNGEMSKETYDTLVELTVQLLKKFNLTEKNLWTHKEVVGWKDCHKWFVDNPKEWEKFKALVGTKLRGEEPMLSKKDSEEVIKYLGKAWNLAKTEEEKNHIHELANAVRKVSEVK